MAVPANAAKNQSHGDDQNNDRGDPACLHSTRAPGELLTLR
jgi:hypothetical protein